MNGTFSCWMLDSEISSATSVPCHCGGLRNTNTLAASETENVLLFTEA